jgi:uncharacterized membrane protein YsdA (DUF1294 family)/cold shock CspA family protein
MPGVHLALSANTKIRAAEEPVSPFGKEMRYKGKIDIWKDDRGFGFITHKADGHQVFVHISSFFNRQRRPVGNEVVTYKLKTDAKGRPQAVSVAFSDESVPVISPALRNMSYLFLAAAFIYFVASATLIGKLPLPVLGIYLVASVVSFIAYALDKSAAKNDTWRTQESMLHLFAVIGGWPGALAAQMLFRHKSKKQSFQIVFWITVILNCVALGYLFSPSGSELFRLLRV